MIQREKREDRMQQWKKWRKKTPRYREKSRQTSNAPGLVEMFQEHDYLSRYDRIVHEKSAIDIAKRSNGQ